VNKALAWILTISILLIYSFFIINSFDKALSANDILKNISSIFAPFPFFIYIYFILANKKNIENRYKKREIKRKQLLIILLISLIATICFIHLYDELFIKNFIDTSIPLFMSSIILAIYTINISFLQSSSLAALLSGSGIGISTYLIFLS